MDVEAVLTANFELVKLSLVAILTELLGLVSSGLGCKLDDGLPDDRVEFDANDVLGVVVEILYLTVAVVNNEVL